MHKLPVTSLPCYPCPYTSICCSWGTDLTDKEAADLGARYGADMIARQPDGSFRTAVRDGKCVFLGENACSIHADPSYPIVCHHFPWRDSEELDKPYGGDLTICPELKAALEASPEGAQETAPEGAQGTAQEETNAERA